MKRRQLVYVDNKEGREGGKGWKGMEEMNEKENVSICDIVKILSKGKKEEILNEMNKSKVCF